MKHILLLFLPSIFIILSYSLQGQSVPTPPNGVWLYDNVFIDQTETANVHWQEYLYYLKRDSSHQIFLAALPDSMVWKQLDLLDTVLHKAYFSGSISRYMPVVGVSYSQALKYCAWRTVFVNRLMAEKGVRFKVEFRLPTEEEWTFAAKARCDYEWGMKKPYSDLSLDKDYKVYFSSIKNQHPDLEEKKFKTEFRKFYKKNQELAINCIHPLMNYSVYGHGLPIDTNKGIKNNIGVFHLFGNVAEMLEEEGIAKGGHFLSIEPQCSIESQQIYNQPTYWLGFRCVAVVEKIKDGKE